MPSSRRTTRGRVALVAATAVLLTGCDLATPPPNRPEPTLAASTTEVEVTSIALPAAGEDSLVFLVRVPTGGTGCASRPKTRVLAYDRSTLQVQTVVESNHASYCTGTATRRLTAALAVRGRRLVVNGQSWEPAAGTSFARCNVAVGCAPPADRCDPVWTGALTPHFDLPPQKRASVVVCAGRWLVMDVVAVRSGIRRWWFAGLDAQRNWQVVASGTAAGCTDVHRAVPAFPRRLCRGLPAR